MEDRKEIGHRREIMMRYLSHFKGCAIALMLLSYSTIAFPELPQIESLSFELKQNRARPKEYKEKVAEWGGVGMLVHYCFGGFEHVDETGLPQTSSPDPFVWQPTIVLEQRDGLISHKRCNELDWTLLSKPTGHPLLNKVSKKELQESVKGPTRLGEQDRNFLKATWCIEGNVFHHFRYFNTFHISKRNRKIFQPIKDGRLETCEMTAQND